MSDKSTTSGDPTDPQPPCAKCGETDHTTGFHDSVRTAESAAEAAS